ncbi:unnamed protein product [Arabidopsis halleri]
MKPQRMRRVLKKKVRAICDFCESSSSNRYEQSPHKREHESLSLESKLKRLRLLTRRMTVKDVDGLSFAELLLLKSKLKEAVLTVKNHNEEEKEKEKEKIKQEEDEKIKLKVDKKLLEQKREAWDKDEATMSSSREKQDDQAPQQMLLLLQSQREIEYERRRAESMESEFERLWLLKERWSGRELKNMTIFELDLLEGQMYQALTRMSLVLSCNLTVFSTT